VCFEGNDRREPLKHLEDCGSMAERAVDQEIELTSQSHGIDSCESKVQNWWIMPYVGQLDPTCARESRSLHVFVVKIVDAAGETGLSHRSYIFLPDW